ncbi:hypothetical protein BDW59DRAFT_149880 [Aspergillus cavernicola]|uniref:Uncharacterized protein n=1 Tax=Aspergillus cavernicola TaxID=176166 RepID=A0ABR4I277_9EURO
MFNVGQIRFYSCRRRYCRLTRIDHLSEIPDSIDAFKPITGQNLTVAVNIFAIEAGPVNRDEGFNSVPRLYDRQPYIWPGLTNEPSEELNNRVFDSVVAKVAGVVAR